MRPAHVAAGKGNTAHSPPSLVDAVTKRVLNPCDSPGLALLQHRGVAPACGSGSGSGGSVRGVAYPVGCPCKTAVGRC